MIVWKRLNILRTGLEERWPTSNFIKALNLRYLQSSAKV